MRFDLIITTLAGVHIKHCIGDVSKHIDAAYDQYDACGIAVRWIKAGVR